MTSDKKTAAKGSGNTRAPEQNLAFGLFGRKLAKPQEPSPQSESTSGDVEIAA